MARKIAILLSAFAVVQSTLAGDLREDIARQRVIALDSINKAYERPVRTTRATSFPVSRPASASAGYGWSSGSTDSFNVFIWRENGLVWISVEPTSGEPFICSPAFKIFQDGFQFDEVKIETSTGDSQCDYLPASTIFLLTNWDFAEAPDWDHGFRLHFQDVIETYSIDIPSTTGEPPGPQVPTYYENGVLYLPYVDTIPWGPFRRVEITVDRVLNAEPASR
jgi:hypothetical protein